MKKMRSSSAIAVLCALTAALTSTSVQSAVVIWSDNFESYSLGIASTVAPAWGAGGPTLDGLWYTGGGLNTSNTSYEIDNQGVGGSKGLTLSVDGSGLVFWNAATLTAATVVLAAPGYALSDLTISFTLIASGLETPQNVTVSLDQDVTGFPSIEKSFTLNSGVNTFSFALNTFTVASPGFSTNNTSSLRFQTFNSSGFGLDPGNSVTLDNVSLVAVPEPSACALFATFCAGLLWFRRRTAAV